MSWLHTMLILFLLSVFSCRKDPTVKTADLPPPYSQPSDSIPNIFVLIIDGPRYSETWGDATHQYIPAYDSLRAYASVFTNFKNEGLTNTVNGHVAICTGYYDTLANDGSELPKYGSFLQYWLQATNVNPDKAWMITSKDKLHVLSNCKDPQLNNTFRPTIWSGYSGPGSGYAEDSLTMHRVFQVMRNQKPKLMVINLKQPDVSGHLADWNAYLNGIKASDKFMKDLWLAIQSDSVYKNKTNVFITNDHGRHLNGIADGYVSHGDTCDGCRHINLMAIGPNIKANTLVTAAYSQTDITATIAKLLKINMPHAKGKVMQEILK